LGVLRFQYWFFIDRQTPKILNLSFDINFIGLATVLATFHKIGLFFSKPSKAVFLVVCNPSMNEL